MYNSIMDSAANANQEGKMEPIVTEYRLKTSANKPIRMATKVIFSDGKVVKFLERMTKRDAIKQARMHL